MSDAQPDLEATAAIARDLIRIDTTNWGEGKSRGETEAAHYVEAALQDLGFEPQLFEADAGSATGPRPTRHDLQEAAR